MLFSNPQIIQQFNDWYQLPAGREILQQTRETLAQWTGSLAGYYAVELVYLESDQHWCHDSHVRSQFTLTPLSLKSSSTVSELDSLPFESESVDVMLLHHIFEFSEDPYAVMREVHRVLIPGGVCMIIAFNPWSIYGLIQRFKSRMVVPWGGEFFPVRRIKDWLSILDFEIDEVSYIAPLGFHMVHNRQRLAWLPQICDRYLPFFGGVFMLSAVKRVGGTIQGAPEWGRAQRFLKPGVAQPTAPTAFRKEMR